MHRPHKSIVYGAVEGLVDEAVFRVLVRLAGGTPGPVFGRHGKEYLRKNLAGYNLAAQTAPWIVLVDLDHDWDCPPPFLNSWLPKPASYMCFRIVVREVEAWLLADRERIANFLGIPRQMVPSEPELVHDPKKLIVRLATHSRHRRIRYELVPHTGSGRDVGPAYNSRLIEYVENKSRGWRPEVAARHSESLARCMHRLNNLLKQSSVNRTVIPSPEVAYY